MLPLIALTVVCALTYSFEIVFGLGGTLMMLPLLGLLFDTKTLVIYSTLPQILVGTIGIARSPRTVELRYLAGMLGFAALGGTAGTWLFYHLDAPLFRRALATTIAVFGVYLLIAPRRLRLPPWGARVFDGMAGVSQSLFGISGPIAMTRLLASFDDKTVVRNYALAFFLAMNVLRAGGYAVAGLIDATVVRMMLVSAPGLAIALWFANDLHPTVSERLFRRAVAWAIVAGGVSMFLHPG